MSVKESEPHPFPLSGLAPFVEVMEYGSMTKNGFGKGGFNGKMLPLTACLEFVKNGIDNLYETTFCLISAFCR